MEESEALRLLVEALEMDEEADSLDVLAAVRRRCGASEEWQARATAAEIRLDDAQRLTAEIRQERDALRAEVAAYRAVLAAEMRRGS